MPELHHIREETCGPHKKAHSLWHKTACCVSYPGKMLVKPFYFWFGKRYKPVGYRYPRLLFGIDLFLLGVIVALAAVAIFFTVFFHMETFADQITLETSTQPRELVTASGAAFEFRYTNTTNEDLTGVRFRIGYPAGFFPERLLLNGTEQAGPVVEIGNFPTDASVVIRTEGAFFGDLGKEQTLRTILTFRRPEKNRKGQKIVSFPVVAARGAIVMEPQLPAKAVTQQKIEGILQIRNEGSLVLQNVLIEPVWPAGFVFLESDKLFKNGAFNLGTLEAGSETALKFTGTVSPQMETNAFAFNATVLEKNIQYHVGYAQAVIGLIPPPLHVSHEIDAESLRPGGSASFTVRYENVGDFPLLNVAVGVETTSAFARKKMVFVDPKLYPELSRVEKGASGEVTISIPLRGSITPAETNVMENIPFQTRALATGLLENQEIQSYGEELTATITTPISLSAFARYTAPGGDQLGRGPLPPVVGEQTTYWIFLNIKGTTNRLEQAGSEATLGPGVRFTGRQSVTEQSGIIFDEKTGTVLWNPGTIPATFSPGSQTVGAAFEVAITPTESQVGTIPVLVEAVRLTARDAVTGAFISASAPEITTNLPNDPRASGNARVEMF